MLTSNSNKQISDTSPSLYLPQIINNLGDKADKVFESNLLPKPSIFDYANESYDDFLVERGKLLSSYIEKVLLV